MAKKRNVVGSICKPKVDPQTGKPKPGATDYIKMRDSGKIYRLESPAFQLESLNQAVEAGKLSPEVAEKVKERISKIPSWVRFELVEFVDSE